MYRLPARNRRERLAGSRTSVSGELFPESLRHATPSKGSINCRTTPTATTTTNPSLKLLRRRKPGTNSAILVEVENRGRPVFYNALHEVEVAGPPSATTNGGDPGNGFLFEHGTSYARVQWQTGIAASVPVQAEGVGEVIIRDFGRMLAGHTQLAAKPPAEFGPYRTVILGGISLSGFFIDTYLAEGFNADPSDGGVVYQGAIAVDGTGNWIAINELAAEAGVEGISLRRARWKAAARLADFGRPRERSLLY